MARAKTVTVFIDEKSKQILESQAVTVQEILDKTSRNFQKQSCDIRYDLKSIKIGPGLSSWKSRLLEIFVFTVIGSTLGLILACVKAVKQKMGSALNRELIKKRTKLVLVLTERLFRGWGYAMFKSELGLNRKGKPSDPNGTGVIILGTHPEAGFITKTELLEDYATVLMHEQGHLYGLNHTDEMGTLMYPLINFANKELDKYSKKQLQQALKRKRS